MDTGEFWGLFMVVLTIGWVITTWIRAKYGYPVENSLGGMTKHPKHSDEFKNSEEMKGQIRLLEERIATLEKIITDNHHAESLEEEISNLKRSA